MKKIAVTLSTIMLAGGLVACTTNNDNTFGDRQGQDNNTTRPIGYYSSENDRLGVNNENDRRGTFGINGNDRNRQSPFMTGNERNNRNQGPITDMLDQTDNNNFGNNPQNYNRRGSMENRGNVGYYDGTDGRLAQKISKRVKDIDNVKDARTIVYGDHIVVGVDTKGNNNDNRIERKVKQSVSDIAQTRNITVVSDDEKMFERIRTVDDDLRNGKAIEELQTDVNGILEDLGNAISRPFQNNR